ncbi:hypothetical protein [Macrococcus armenti]|uniref:hypothetical protein n=1 Tax=Macrococcus armenti TaxID=2875764 RepID=UPI001CD03AA8|nr:hypothetical protein [Macrococcus armenti]UBH15906.1 hypothetical protein LAU44_02855 [Macrococcus armenti]UBH18267.1 hypothetical protein LAU39_02865 [Macrococcus armenti]UBH20532.1 hypothetical protein LAU40_02855 [Macrococcus armenti]
MSYLLIGNIVMTLFIFLFFYFKEKKLTYIHLNISTMITVLTNYPLLGHANFISKTFVLFIGSISVMHLYLRYYHADNYNIYIHNKWLHFLLALLFNISIPFIIIHSDESIYLSSAYLSVSFFIIGLIMYQLSEVNGTVKWFQFEYLNIYKYINHPKRIGEYLFAISFMLLVMFIPYNYIYFVLGIIYIIYIKQSLLFNNQ